MAPSRHANEGGQLQLMDADRVEDEEECFESIDKRTSRPLSSRLASRITCSARARLTTSNTLIDAACLPSTAGGSLPPSAVSLLGWEIPVRVGAICAWCSAFVCFCWVPVVGVLRSF